MRDVFCHLITHPLSPGLPAGLGEDGRPVGEVGGALVLHLGVDRHADGLDDVRG